MNNYSSNSGGSDNSAAFWIIGGVCGFAILICLISACNRMKRRSDEPNSSQTSQAAPAAVNGGSAEKDGNLTIDVTEPAVSAMQIAADLEGGGGGGGGVSVGCCCGGGDSGDGGGCGGCGGD